MTLPVPGTTVDVVTLTTRLTEARLAYHKLQTGSMRETVDHNGTRIQYSRADAGKLKQYIDELLGDIAVAATPEPQRRRRMIVNYFGPY